MSISCLDSLVQRTRSYRASFFPMALSNIMDVRKLLPNLTLSFI